MTGSAWAISVIAVNVERKAWLAFYDNQKCFAMKIVFLLGCLEPEKDGVGDYTRLLAGECVRQGHDCSIIALNDKFAQGVLRDSGSTTKVETLRLPANIPWCNRRCIAKEQIDAFRPDWISLQFVCYGFQKKGVMAFAGNHIASLSEGYKTHIMFHELWVGAANAAKLKGRLTGTIQKPFILGMTRAIKPVVVHTNTRAYAAVLCCHGIQAGILPLFGNISITSQKGDDWLFPKLNETGLTVTPATRGNFWLFGIFGALHPAWPPEPFMSYLKKAAIAHGKKGIIISAGYLRGGEFLWKKISDKYSRDFIFSKLDHLPEREVSELFNSLDFGIATTPYALCEKSSSVVSMLEHGVPVVANWDDTRPGGVCLSGGTEAPLLYETDECLPEELVRMKRCPAKSMLPKAADIFLTSLEGAQLKL